MGYGNSIVLPLAVAFVEAVIESFAEAAVAAATTSADSSEETAPLGETVVEIPDAVKEDAA